MDRQEFYRKVPTQEANRFVGVSYSDNLQDTESCLLQVTNTSGGFTCAYLSDDHARQLRDAINAYLAIPRDVDQVKPRFLTATARAGGVHFSLTDNPELAYTYEKREEAEQTLAFAMASDSITDELEIEEITNVERNQHRFRMRVVEKQEPRTWRNQFPPDMAVPYQIEDFVKSGILEDTSWGNDAMASFEFVGYEGDDESERRFNRGELDLSRYRVWVDYPDANRREGMDEGLRFTINRYSPFNETELEEKPVFESNSIQETLDAIVARFFQSFVWVDRAIAMCPWSDCGDSDIADRHDSGYHDSMRPESGVRREELQCNGCGREWTMVIGKESYVVIDEGMRQIEKEAANVNA